MLTNDSLTPDAQTIGAVRRLLEEQLLTDISSDDDLFAAGLLDSLGLVDLLVRLEERFGVEVPVSELDVNDFRSIGTIAAFVDRLAAHGTSVPELTELASEGHDRQHGSSPASLGPGSQP